MLPCWTVKLDQHAEQSVLQVTVPLNLRPLSQPPSSLTPPPPASTPLSSPAATSQPPSTKVVDWFTLTSLMLANASQVQRFISLLINAMLFHARSNFICGLHDVIKQCIVQDV